MPGDHTFERIAIDFTKMIKFTMQFLIMYHCLSFNGKEIAEQDSIQDSLYAQNEQLWLYVQELIDCTKVNVVHMRNHSAKLEEELRTAYSERAQVAERLQLAKNAKKVDTYLITSIERSILLTRFFTCANNLIIV